MKNLHKNLHLVKVAQEARAAFQASDDAWNEMNKMFGDHSSFFSIDYDAKKDEWVSTFEIGMDLDASIKGYFRSLKWSAA